MQDSPYDNNIYTYLARTPAPTSTKKKKMSDIGRSALRTSQKEYDSISLYAALYGVVLPPASSLRQANNHHPEDDEPLSPNTQLNHSQFAQEHNSPIIERSSAPSSQTIIEQPVIIVPVDPIAQAQTIRYGLFNLWREPSRSAPVRDAEASAALRLNMVNLYLKFVIQTLLYLLTAYLLWSALSLCFQVPTYILIPLTIIGALHLAARRMHQTDHELDDSNGYRFHSITGPYEVISDTNIIIDRIANYSVGFFSGFARRLSHTTALDNQITYVPENRI
ncbi:MAG: hypothetical protein ACO1N3_04345 [Gammaproteobacteria bacterium]